MSPTVEPSWSEGRRMPIRFDAMLLYLTYNELKLYELRALLGDFESVYNNLINAPNILDSNLLSNRIAAKRLAVEQVQTGNSISILLLGDPHVIGVFGELLKLIHSNWVAGTVMAGATIRGLKELANLRNIRLQGEKTKAETEKTRLEGEKTKAETDKIRLESEKTIAEIGKLRLEDARSKSEIERANYEANLVSERKLQRTMEKLSRRLLRIRNSSRITSLEIGVPGHRYLVSHNAGELLQEITDRAKKNAGDS